MPGWPCKGRLYGSLSACQIVGSRYEQGLTVEQNVSNALAYYEEACSLIYDDSFRDDPDYGCVDYERLKRQIDE